MLRYQMVWENCNDEVGKSALNSKRNDKKRHMDSQRFHRFQSKLSQNKGTPISVAYYPCEPNSSANYGHNLIAFRI